MERFTEAFQKETQSAISAFVRNHKLNQNQFPSYLTASGGVVFCKLSHPFVATSALVEEATGSAKELSKSGLQNGQIAPASVTFCRTSTVVTSDFNDYLQRTSYFEQIDNRFGVTDIVLASEGYLLAGEGGTLENLRALAIFCRSGKSPMSIAKWRQMETHLSVGDFNEAQRIFERACKLTPAGVAKLESLCKAVLAPVPGEFKGWFVVSGNGAAHSFIHDLLVFDHFDYAKSVETAREIG